MRIRPERQSEYGLVCELVKEAFASAKHSDGNEGDLVALLRKGDAFVPELSLVAEMDGRIVGHILFTKAQIGPDVALALAPLSVLPTFQGRGVGSALVREGHRIAGKLGYGHCLVLGSVTFYSRFGYRPAAEFGVTAPEGLPPDMFMALKLRDDARPVAGVAAYAKEFCIERRC